MKHFIKCSMVVGLLGLCACQKSKDPAPAPTKQPTLATTATISLTPDLVTTPEPTPTLAPTPEPTLTPEPTRAPIPTGMPERKVKEYDASVDTIPISEEYFSDAEFRKIISELVDTNKDGMLSREEREAVIQLGDYETTWGCLFGCSSRTEHFRIDGLEWFPNLEELAVDCSKLTVCIDKHPSFKLLMGYCVGSLFVFANECDKFERVSVSEGWVEATIIKCKNFQDIYVHEGSLLSAYFEETPKFCLSEWVRGRCSMGTEAGIFPWDGYYNSEEVCPMIGCRFSLTEDGKFDLFPVEWRGYDALGLNLKEWCEKMKTMNEEQYHKEISPTDVLKTSERVVFFSPERGGIFCVDSSQKAEEGVPVNDKCSRHYYIVDAHGQISMYDSLEKLYEAAANPDGMNLPNLQLMMKAES